MATSFTLQRNSSSTFNIEPEKIKNLPSYIFLKRDGFRIDKDYCKSYKDFQISFAQNSHIFDLVNDRWAFLHTESMRFAYFLDPKTKAGKGFVDDDAIDNSLNLIDFIILTFK
jgi:hypothetical protein